MSGKKKEREHKRPRMLGRNDLCSCGSGLKYKKCCLLKLGSTEQRVVASRDGMAWEEPPPAVRAEALQLLAEKERKERERVARFGQVRPQISMEWRGERLVAVRNRIYHSSKWKFFTDFLRDYVPEILGVDWCKAEATKPEAERNPIVTWRMQAAEYMNAQPAQPDGSRAALPCGALGAFNCFAYDLYIVDDNGGLDESLLQRLKNREFFQGARHELFAEATCYRAGFTVQHEDEKDRRSRHAEFTVRHMATGQVLSVEAKSRHRRGVLAVPGTPDKRPDFRLGRLINDAAAKRPEHPLVVFVDANLPFKWAERVLGRQAGNAISRPMQILLDAVKENNKGTDPYCMIVFSNHPHHYAIRDLDPQRHLLSVLAQQLGAHPLALGSLHAAADPYGNIPMGFSIAEGDPPQPAVPTVWPKVRYDFRIDGTNVTVLREGNIASQSFSTTDKDRKQAPSKLHEFLEDIGLSRVDAHMICTLIEEGKSVSGIFALK